jgi:hypothetical protein
MTTKHWLIIAAVAVVAIYLYKKNKTVTAPVEGPSNVA